MERNEAGPPPIDRGHRLLWWGTLLFLLGLLVGFLVPVFANPRIGLSAHLQGVQNGLFLLALGLLWPRLRLSTGAEAWLFWLALYGTFANWAGTLVSAASGATGMMQVTAGGVAGDPLFEGVVAFLLASLSVAMVAVCLLMLRGLGWSAGFRGA